MLLIVVDDLRFDDFSAAGHPFSRTPNIDRLAREGALFRNVFAVTPLCSPSRANILTGLYTRRHGILDNTNRSPRSHELQTFRPAAARQRLRHRLHRKVAHGQRPHPEAGLRLLGRDEGSGRGDRSRALRKRPARARHGLRHGHLHRARARLSSAEQRRALPPDAVSQGAPSEHPSAGRRHHRRDRRRRLHSRRTAQGTVHGRDSAARDNYGVPPRGKPALERRIDGVRRLARAR